MKHYLYENASGEGSICIETVRDQDVKLVVWYNGCAIAYHDKPNLFDAIYDGHQYDLQQIRKRVKKLEAQLQELRAKEQLVTDIIQGLKE